MPRDGGEVSLHDPLVLRVVISLVLDGRELLDGVSRFGRYLLVLRQFRLPPNSGIVWIFGWCSELVKEVALAVGSRLTGDRGARFDAANDS